MGLAGMEGPPKKKLKQAQLNFCISSEKTSNKRKLSDSADGLAPKLIRTDPGTPKESVTQTAAPKTPVFNKENVVGNTIDKKKNDDQRETEPQNDVVVVLDDEIDDKNRGTEHSIIHAKEEDDTHKSDECDDKKTETEPIALKQADSRQDTVSPSKDEAAALPSDTVSESGANDESKSADPEQVANDEVDPKPSNNTELDDSKLDTSADCEQGDANTSVISSEDEPTSSPNMKTTPVRKTAATPKSSAKKAEREKQREEKLRLKREKEEQKRKEKEEKEKKKREEQRLKEEEKKKKEEERKRKEEEKKRKEEERKKKEEAKEEEKRKKEEERKKKEEMKEEDRRKKEEARLAEERKENLAKAAFTKFFITEKNRPSLPKKDETEAQAEKAERSKFMPFPVKSDMRLAVQVRHTLSEEEKSALSEILLSGAAVEDTYIKELKNGRKPRTSPATWPLSDEQHDVIIVESVEDEKANVEQESVYKAKSKGQKAKLLQFHENRRPPYWGTWRKPSKMVGPRRPFGQDKILDYEVDSDSEWEDEEEGEDIEKEDGDSDKEEADDEDVGENGYMLDNVFVPHGYLSDEEAAEAEDDDSVEDQKLKLTVLKQEFDQELKSKTLRLQPRLLGCVTIGNAIVEVSKSIYEPLMKLRCGYDEELIDVTSPGVVECSPSPVVFNAKFPSSMVEQLAKLIHGNRSSMKALISEFLHSSDKDTQLSSISKRAVFLKVKEIATKTYNTGSGRLVWAVNPDLCAELGLEPIVDPPKTAPAVSPMVETPKPKAHTPLATFLKKASVPQGNVKRVSTTLIPRNGPPGTSSQGAEAVHVDTPRPKVTPQGSVVSGRPDKPIRRVPTTLLSMVPGPVKNKTFNVSEIDKSAQAFPSGTKTGSSTIDLTDSNDGITPLPDAVNPSDAAANLNKSFSEPTVKPANPAGAGSANPLNKCSKPAPMDIDGEKATGGASSADTTHAGSANSTPNDIKPSSMETDDSPEPSTDSAACSDVKPTSVLDDVKPSTVPDGVKPSTFPDDVKPSTAPDGANPAVLAKPSDIPKLVPSTTPVRKRVPLITLSKSVSKNKNDKTPGQKQSIADMFCRKPAKKVSPSKSSSLDQSTVVDLIDD